MTPPLTGSNATDAYLGLTLILVGFTVIACLVLGWLDWKERIEPEDWAAEGNARPQR